MTEHIGTLYEKQWGWLDKHDHPKIIDWSKSTYSGVDVSVIATLNFGTLQEAFIQNSGVTVYGEEDLKKVNGLVYELGTAQTISCQAHRPKVAVRSIGNVAARGYTRGPRTIAGSMIFTVLNNHSLRSIAKHMEEIMMSYEGIATVLPDQILPIDLTFLLMNEYGSVSRMALYGVEFLNHGQTMSVEDLLLEEVVQFVALDMDPLSDITDKVSQSGGSKDRSLKASDVFKSNLPSYIDLLSRINVRRRF